MAISRNDKPRVCPWCKDTPKVEQDMDSSWYVACSNSHCAVAPITAGYSYPWQAVAVWNCCELPDVMPKPINK